IERNPCVVASSLVYPRRFRHWLMTEGNISQDHLGLTRQRYAMDPPHLCFRRRNFPFGCVQIEFHPLGIPQLSWTHEENSCKLQSRDCGYLTVKAIDGSQHRADCLWVSYRRSVLYFWRGQRAA